MSVTLHALDFTPCLSIPCSSLYDLTFPTPGLHFSSLSSTKDWTVTCCTGLNDAYHSITLRCFLVFSSALSGPSGYSWRLFLVGHLHLRVTLLNSLTSHHVHFNSIIAANIMCKSSLIRMLIYVCSFISFVRAE